MNDSYMPCVVRETSEGVTRIPIVEEMYQRREIQLVGDIDQEPASNAILQLRHLQAQDAHEEITIFINSPGGSVPYGLALIDVMAAISCPIRTVCMGTAASMAALIFASGNERDMMPHARVMIHDPLLAGGVGGPALKVDALAKDLMYTREVTAKILAERTGHTLEEVYEKTAQDTYFDAREALDWGLADRIIHEI